VSSNRFVSAAVLVPYRLGTALLYFAGPLSSILRWLLRSREYTNFTFDLTDRSLLYLASTIALSTGQPLQTVKGFIEEPAHDQALQNYIRETVRASRFRLVSDETPRFGKRLGWYAMARCLKPAVIVETGIDKGLGSVLLCAALLRNAEEGYPGQYYGTDINPEAGYMLAGRYATVGKILFGDSIESLNKLQSDIDLFINDSDHSVEYELREYQTIQSKLSPRGIIISDNAHCSDSLCQFANESGRNFIFYGEEPKDHWYPGGGLGISYPR
jgi:predicted O-methyltransferase YrrM